MDEAAKQAMREHYNQHAVVGRDSREANASRHRGRAYPLKNFHNGVKRALLRRFAAGTASLLDLCCGRGGDLKKWWDVGVQYVCGIDLAEQEVAEAISRYNTMLESNRKRPGGHLMQADFFPYGSLGDKRLEWDRQFEVATCMFAIHYFFVREAAIKMFLTNVAAALQPGGHFIATFPDGKRVLWALKGRPEFRSEMLTLKRCWEGDPRCFGSAYNMAIADTVTEGGDGSLEYLVFFNALLGVARQCGLVPVEAYGDADLDAKFWDEDRGKPVKHFKPPFKAELEGDRSLATASEIFCCVVFRKALPAAGGSRFPATAGGKRPAEAATAGPAGPDAKKPRATGRAPPDYSDL